jgi:hypothetical protein
MAPDGIRLLGLLARAGTSSWVEHIVETAPLFGRLGCAERQGDGVPVMSRQSNGTDQWFADSCQVDATSACSRR